MGTQGDSPAGAVDGVSYRSAKCGIERTAESKNTI